MDRFGQISLRPGLEPIMGGAGEKWWQPVTTPKTVNWLA